MQVAYRLIYGVPLFVLEDGYHGLQCYYGVPLFVLGDGFIGLLWCALPSIGRWLTERLFTKLDLSSKFINRQLVSINSVWALVHEDFGKN